MSVQAAASDLPYGVSKWMSAEKAIEAKKEAEAKIESLGGIDKLSLEDGKPITVIAHTPLSRDVANRFRRTDTATGVTQILQIPEDQVENRYKGANLGFVKNLTAPFRQKAPQQTDVACSIIALDRMTFSNGLPALGENDDKFELGEGDALHFFRRCSPFLEWRWRRHIRLGLLENIGLVNLVEKGIVH